MRAGLINAGAALLALAAGTAGAVIGGRPAARRVAESRPAADGESVGAGGAEAVIDATGVAVPAGDYRRIASGTIIADDTILELLPQDRLIAVSDWTLQNHPRGWRFDERIEGIQSLEDLERLLSLDADLLIVASASAPSRVERLRESGLTVFDLGQMKGLETLLPNIRALGKLLKQEERAEDFARRFVHRLETVASGLAPEERRGAMYLSVYGEAMYGGSTGTSYSDVIRYAGLRDLAAEAGFTGWPQYTAEQLITLDPELIISPPGTGDALCSHEHFQSLQVCREPGRIIEVCKGLVSTPGTGILDAAESVYFAVYEEPIGCASPWPGPER